MEWTVLTISSCLLEEMSADSHRRREDPEREPVTKGRSYNPHIVLLQAPTHPASSLESQRMYFPINSPPTPAPSPRPQLPYTGLPLLSRPSRQIHVNIQPDVNELHIVTLASNTAPDPYCPVACTPNKLLFLSQTIAPLLKRDFLTTP
jgi:hypothetical protein